MLLSNAIYMYKLILCIFNCYKTILHILGKRAIEELFTGHMMGKNALMIYHAFN